MIAWMPLVAVVVVLAVGVVALRWPREFRPYSEMLRSLSLVAGVALLAWNLAIAVTVLALDAGGLLVAGGFFEAQRIQQSLVLVGPVAVLAVFGGTWLYLALLDHLLGARRRRAAAAS